MTLTRLKAGPIALTLDPALGGAVTHCAFDGRDVFRPMPAGARDAAEAAAFPLVPFPNRIAGGAFVFEGQSHVLAPDRAGDRHALHGAGWRSAWTLENAEGASALMRLDALANWPWRCRARKHVAVREDGIDIALDLENMDAQPMPAGLGWHPAFACGAGARLRLDAHAYLPTADDIPLTAAPLPDHWTFRSGVAIERLSPIDHCLIGWDGALTFERDDLSVRLAAPGCAFLQVYAPTGADFVCLEPQTCAPDAFNRGADFGARRLAPGETLSLRIRIDIAARA